MWEEVKEKIDHAAQILMDQMEASGKPYPADVYGPPLGYWTLG